MGDIMINKKNIVSFLNMKGGVCKTTLCKEIALYLSERCEKKVLVIDIDPQSNCTQSFFERFDILKIEDGELITDKSKLPSIENIFSKGKSILAEPELDSIILKLTDNLHIIPGDLHTVFMERETGTGASEQRLFNFFDETKLNNEYNYVFIDCPPTYSFYTVSALLASNYYLVPLKPDAYSLLGLDLLEEVVSELRKSYRTNFAIKPINNLGVLFTMIPRVERKGVDKNIAQLKYACDSKGITYFENDFPKVDKLSTSKLSTFIIDREDRELIKSLSEICEEFESKVENYNGNQESN